MIINTFQITHPRSSFTMDLHDSHPTLTRPAIVVTIVEKNGTVNEDVMLFREVTDAETAFNARLDFYK